MLRRFRSGVRCRTCMTMEVHMPWRKRVVFGGACLAGLLAAGYAGYVGWQQSVVDQMLLDLKAAGSPVSGVGIEVTEVERTFGSRRLEVVFHVQGLPEMPLRGECVWRLGMAPSLVVRHFRTTPELQAFVDKASPQVTMDFGLPFMPKNLRVHWLDAEADGRTTASGEALTTFRIVKAEPVEKDGRLVPYAPASGVPYHVLPVEGDWGFSAFVFRLNWAGERLVYRFLPDETEEPVILTAESDGAGFSGFEKVDAKDDVKFGRSASRLSARKVNAGWRFDFSHDGSLEKAPADAGPLSALRYWHFQGSVTAPEDVWLPEAAGRLLAGADVCSVPGICRPGAPQGFEPLMQAAQDGRLGLKMQNVELDFPRLEVRAMGAMGVREGLKTFADFDVGVQIHPLDDELMKTRPDVVAVHDFVKDLVDSKALACRVKDECRARVTVEPDERGFGIIRSNGVDVTEKVMKFIFAGPAGTGEAG